MKRRPSQKKHLGIETVLDFLEDRLDEDSKRRVEEHLGAPCEACRNLLHESGLLLARMRQDRGPDVPAAWRQRAVDLFESSPRPARTAPLRTLLARLLLDTGAVTAPAAARSAVGAGRRLAYALGAGSLEVETEPEGPGAMSIRGILRLEQPALHEICVDAGGDRRAVHPDAQGRFALDSIPMTRIVIVVAGPAGRWRIPPFSPR